MGIVEIDYTCEGCGIAQPVTFRKPNAIGRTVVRFSCKGCKSRTLLHAKLARHTKQIGIALIGFTPGKGATLRTKAVKPDPAVIMP